ncbi:ChbG/HpnK family deacetylase [Atopococcus tabaci]|uniref:ChbG/HpnK family deacetylase n=1 Tax=Atopococcus tabaci TaxID=269774 RepID=UPI0003F4EDCA|nr:ChbG/HpnK family deacetylase [Atopococcus tabaci]
MNVIVRADDLGYSEAVNYGIAKAVKQGIVNNVGLMVNMPYAKHGYDLIANDNICLGLHANISAGEPISSIEEVPALIEEKQFKKSAVYRSSVKDFVNIDEAVLEVQNQVNRFKEITGFAPHYIDIHAVLNPNFLSAAKAVAEQNEILFVDVNVKSGTILLNNQGIKMQVENGKDEEVLYDSFFSTVLDNKEAEIPMIVYHPGFIDAPLIKSSSVVTERAFQVSFLTSEEVKSTAVKYEIDFLRIDEV